jgi:hypothetical protein
MMLWCRKRRKEILMAKIDDLAAAFTDYQNAVMAKLVDMNAKIEALSVPSDLHPVVRSQDEPLAVRAADGSPRNDRLIDTTTTEPEMISLPSDFQSMRASGLSSVSANRTSISSPARRWMNTGSARERDRASRAIFTIFGSEIELAPTPDANYTIEMVYRKNIPALATNSTNWLLTLAPDALSLRRSAGIRAVHQGRRAHSNLGLGFGVRALDGAEQSRADLNL